MKRIYLITLLIAITSFQCILKAQIDNTNRFDTDKNTVYVDIQLRMTDFYVDDNEYLVLLPVMQSGTQTLDLLKVILYGKDLTTSDAENGPFEPYTILKMENRRNFIYQVDIPYQPWMDHSTLKLKRTLYGSDGVQKYEFVDIIKNTLTQSVQLQNTVSQSSSKSDIPLFPALHETKNQNNSSNGFEKQGDDVYINVRLRMTDYFVDDYESLVITPSIQSDTETQDLLKVILNGKRQTRTSISDDTERPYTVLNMNNRSDIAYQVNVPYQSWMDKSKLKLKRAIYSEDGTIGYELVSTLNNSLVQVSQIQNVQQPVFTQQPTTPVQQITVIAPVQQQPVVTQSYPAYISAPVKTDVPSNVLELYFTNKGSYDINTTNNRPVIENICNKIDSILNKNNNALIFVDITAGTCPYGIYYDNEQLTRKQASAFKAYLESRYKRSNLNIYANYISEDWPGLVKLVEQDNNMPNRYEVLNIINNSGIFTGRERMLMELAGGKPYRYMKANLFPHLWKIKCKVSY